MLTIKGIPLFYPFKKNPCVIPGNPKYRFHAANYKTEGMMFGFFILLTFSLQDLFANGFWNTYNRTWDSVKALYTEKLLTDKMIKVDYEFSINNVAHKGKGILVDATLSEAIIFDKQFFKVQKSDRIIHLTPIRTDKNLILKQETFTDVSFDSLQKIINNKALISLKLQSTLPIQFNKDNKPQSSNSVDLDYIYNPVLQSQNIDSMDLTIAKEIELTKQELFNNEAQLKIYHMQQSQYEEQKKEAFAKYAEVRENINSSDLATRERAMKDLPAAKNKYESFNQIKSQSVNQIAAINVKMEFLKSKLYVKKAQSINGFISYFQIN